MPLFEKARIEVYIPDLRTEAYQDLIDAFEEEFTYSFGGCSIMRGLDGSYLSQQGTHVRDRVTLVYTDLPLPFDKNMNAISVYSDELRNAAYQALDEESILVTALKVFHSD